jgi:predicted PurR-regulated permease PerM
MQFLHEKRERAGLLIALLGIAIAVALSTFAVGLLGAAVLYVLCGPAYRWLARFLKPHIAAAITLVGAVVVIALPVMWIVALLADKVPETLRSVQQSTFPTQLALLHLGPIDVGAELAKASGTFFQWLSQQAFDVVGGAAKATLNLVISFFALYYMLVSADHSWTVFREVLPFSEASAAELRVRFYSVTHATILGTLVTAILQGSLVGAGFAIVGLPNPLFWGVVTGFVSILPVLGSALVWLPGTIVLVAQENYVGALILFVIGAVLASNIDNIVRPLVFKRVSNIHPLVTLIGAFAGVKYFGLLGILLGPLAIQYFFELLRLYRAEYVVGRPPEPVFQPREVRERERLKASRVRDADLEERGARRRAERPEREPRRERPERGERRERRERREGPEPDETSERAERPGRGDGAVQPTRAATDGAATPAPAEDAEAGSAEESARSDEARRRRRRRGRGRPRDAERGGAGAAGRGTPEPAERPEPREPGGAGDDG